jgi:hypothetical protein
MSKLEMTNENIILNHIIGEMSFKIKATKCTFTSSEEFLTTFYLLGLFQLPRCVEFSPLW